MFSVTWEMHLVSADGVVLSRRRIPGSPELSAGWGHLSSSLVLEAQPLVVLDTREAIISCFPKAGSGD